jgi:hypothetical protein
VKVGFTDAWFPEGLDASPGGPQQPDDQVQDRRLPAAIGSQQGKPLARFQREAAIGEHRSPGIVRKLDVFEAD